MSHQNRLGTTALVAIAIQLIMALLWAGSAANQINRIEGHMERLTALEIREARLEEQTDHLREALIRIEVKLDSIVEEEAKDGSCQSR